MKILYHILILLVACFTEQINTDDEENFFSNEDVQKGVIFPDVVEAFNGEDVLIRLVRTIANQQSCRYVNAVGGEGDALVQSGRITQWDNYPCGIRIRNISLQDTGFWRLTSQGATGTIRGISFLDIKESITPPTSLLPVNDPTNDIAPKDTQYCYIVRPGQERSEFPQHGKCVVPTVDKELDANGEWNVFAGIEGRTEEYKFDIYVEADVEKLINEVEKSTNKINLKCNFVNSEKKINWCRFLRMYDGVGFNIIPGQGELNYGYLGDGFNKGHCGMSIENPTTADRNIWRCFMGFTELDVEFSAGAILDASDTAFNINNIQADDVYGLKGGNVHVLCKTNIAFDYCWFLTPNGNRLSVSDLSHRESNENELFFYHGTGFKMGECGITLREGTLEDSGTWRCHMGLANPTGMEASKSIKVRISESHLVASDLEVEGITGQPLYLQCNTIPIHMPLEYCRFVMPNGVGFSINENVTSANPIMDNIYFNPDSRLRAGGCSIVIHRSNSDHAGKWTCGGLLVGRDLESTDDFTVTLSALNNNRLGAASVIGMAIGGIVIVAAVLFIGIRAYRRRQHGLISDNISNSSSIDLGNISAT